MAFAPYGWRDYVRTANAATKRSEPNETCIECGSKGRPRGLSWVWCVRSVVSSTAASCTDSTHCASRLLVFFFLFISIYPICFELSSSKNIWATLFLYALLLLSVRPVASCLTTSLTSEMFIRGAIDSTCQLGGTRLVVFEKHMGPVAGIDEHSLVFVGVVRRPPLVGSDFRTTRKYIRHSFPHTCSSQLAPL